MQKSIQEIIHYPRLDTVIMVEEAIKKAREYPTKAALLRSLKKKVMYQTFLVILGYLEESNKIHVDKRDGRVVWIWNPKGVDDILSCNLVAR
ncbi:MAG: hypothetical protein AABW86_04485 [Candidatus Micrarchaeota archaeon]